MWNSLFGIPIPPPWLLKAEFATCRPANKAESKGEEENQERKRKDVDHQADENPAPSAREETEGGEANGEEIRKKAKRFKNQNFQRQENDPKEHAREEVVRRKPGSKSKGWVNLWQKGFEN